MDLKPIKEASLGGAVAPVRFSLYDTEAGDADVMANRYGKTIDAVVGLQVKLFDDLSYTKEQFTRQLAYAMHPPVKAAFAKHSRHKSGRVNKADGLLHIAPKVAGCNQHYGNNLGIVSLAALDTRVYID